MKAAFAVLPLALALALPADAGAGTPLVDHGEGLGLAAGPRYASWTLPGSTTRRVLDTKTMAVWDVPAPAGCRPLGVAGARLNWSCDSNGDGAGGVYVRFMDAGTGAARDVELLDDGSSGSLVVLRIGTHWLEYRSTDEFGSEIAWETTDGGALATGDHGGTALDLDYRGLHRALCNRSSARSSVPARTTAIRPTSSSSTSPRGVCAGRAAAPSCWSAAGRSAGCD
jgi:hypothetical protein